jgi:flagellar basal body L-ring protein FlgH
LFKKWFDVQSSTSFKPIPNQAENQDKGKFASFKVLAALYSKIAFFWDRRPRQSGDTILAF